MVSRECTLTGPILGAFRDVELGTSTLRPFADLFRMIETIDDDVDWGNFLEQARSERTFRIAERCSAAANLVLTTDNGQSVCGNKQDREGTGCSLGPLLRDHGSSLDFDTCLVLQQRNHP